MEAGFAAASNGDFEAIKAIADVIMTILGQIIGQPNFDSVGQFKITASATEYVQPGTIVTALVNFLLVAAAVYFAIVMPMNKVSAMSRRVPAPRMKAPTTSSADTHRPRPPRRKAT